ncbi:MAG TPA: Gfo/Idh/MocA family oxidoreductase [Firmicutes bacterium]|nr:Gfo/Idh/MocA family oxidoreductase [Bacillota bacterium]
MGIVGGGKAGRNLALAFKAAGRAEVAVFCTRHEDSAREAARWCDVPHWTTDLEAMLADDSIDALVIATPDEYHCEQTVMAARAGKHVLCEKPMCRSLEEAERMIEEAERHQVILMIGFTERYSHPCHEAKRRIDEGEIGTPRMILARRCHPRSIVRGRSWLNDLETGGVLNYAGTHNIDLICWFMGARPERVYAEMGQLILTGQNFTDGAVMTFRFSNGGIAALYETFAYPGRYPHGVDRNIEILGDRGVIKIDFMSQPLMMYTEEGAQVVDSITWPAAGGKIGGALQAEVEHFIRCIESGERPLTSGAEGKLALQIALAAREAAQSGKAVTIGKV